MAVVGSFGNVVFEVSDRKKMGFSDFQHDAGARIESAEIVGREPITVWLGPDVENISFSIKLLSQLGVDPLGEYERLKSMCTKGVANSLVLDGKPFGGSGTKWLIEKVSGAFNKWSRKGNPQWIDCSISLKKYGQVSK